MDKKVIGAKRTTLRKMLGRDPESVELDTRKLNAAMRVLMRENPQALERQISTHAIDVRDMGDRVYITMRNWVEREMTDFIAEVLREKGFRVAQNVERIYHEDKKRELSHAVLTVTK